MIALTAANIVLISLAAFRGVEYMDSPEFCGEVCHVVMQPEFTAYREGPHARVACVACHIGPGAPWFVQSKLSGTRQLFAVALKTYPEPIPSPVENLRPARDTCEQCHWPEKFTGDRVRQIREYAEDEANTETRPRCSCTSGAGATAPARTAFTGTWRRRPRSPTSRPTPSGQKIVWVEVADRNGVRTFKAEGVTDEQLRKGETRVMDCMDCHNRPSHRFDSKPERAVERGHRPRPDPEDAAVRPPRGGRGAEDRLQLAGCGRGRHRHTALGVLRPATRRRDGREEDRYRQGHYGHSGHLPPERLPGDEGLVGHLRQQHRARRLRRVFPLPRRHQEDGRRPGDRAGLRTLPQDAIGAILLVRSFTRSRRQDRLLRNLE